MLNKLYKNVLAKNTWVKLELLHLLEESDSKPNIYQLTKKIKVATNTLYKYIKELNEALSLNHNIAKIENSSSTGLKIMIYDKHKYQIFVKELVTNELGIVILSRLLLGYEINFYHIIQEFFISETSVRRRIKEINQYLCKYGLEIKSRKHHLSLFGNEGQIRLFADYFFWKVYGKDFWSFQEIKQEKVDFFMKQLQISQENCHASISQNELVKIKNFIGIIAIRLKNKKTFKIPDCLEREKELLCTNHIKKIQSDKELLLPENEIVYLYLHILKDPQFSMEGCGKKIMNMLKNNASPLSRLNYLFFSSIQSQLIELTASEKDLIYPYIFSKHLYLFLYPEWDDSAISPFLDHQYKILDQKITRLVDSVIKSNLFNLENHTMNFLKINYTLIFNLLRPLSHFEKEVSIMIDANFDILHKNLITSRIVNALKNNFNIQVTASDFSDEYAETDIIITSTNKLDWLDVYEEGKIISIHDFPNEEDILKISKKIESYLNN